MKLSKRPLQNIKNIRSSHVVIGAIALWLGFGLILRLIPGSSPLSVIDSIKFLFTPGLLEVQNMEDVTSPFSSTSYMDIALNNNYRIANMGKIGFWALLPIWILSFLFKKPDNSEEISNVYSS